ncbi:hypothetical protein ACPSMW_001249 [Escherichia coli]|uniref:hypothetical protein n=1 Tax=Enterobacteriaceae TaxID=543 RepID=UPI0004D9238C|nr:MULTISPECIES: hypothetical protein [Enterobacteriaceae]EKK5411210.1 hypothetical protein [Enterobacter cloacae]HCM9543614.1 hypothetical protein [Enterobacter hormaechei subsp. xiangfangensis]EHO0059150.1 hypothetical protein [Escherichia coli]EHZ3652231.1 hypothetical protein [Escherichia coli]EIA6526301.1 hypothetical protein [Escherichia coli]
MTPEQFRQWFATLPPNYQSTARTMYDNARKSGTHTASSLALIHTLVTDQIKFDSEFNL